MITSRKNRQIKMLLAESPLLINGHLHYHPKLYPSSSKVTMPTLSKRQTMWRMMKRTRRGKRLLRNRNFMLSPKSLTTISTEFNSNNFKISWMGEKVMMKIRRRSSTRSEARMTASKWHLQTILCEEIPLTTRL